LAANHLKQNNPMLSHEIIFVLSWYTNQSESRTNLLDHIINSFEKQEKELFEMIDSWLKLLYQND
jgi:hypothetical protein